MSQQYPFGNSNDKYKKKLFVDTGAGYVEVKARIIEPYTPPTPQHKVKEIELINAPSHFHETGISSYKASLTLLFYDKSSYNDYLAYVGWTHKFYDEKGSIFLGTVDSVKPEVKVASTMYKLEIELILIKKDEYDRQNRFQFQDLVATDGTSHWAKADIEEMANLGLVTVITVNGEPVIYFRPEDFITRAEFIVFLNRTRRLLERIIRE